jgi:hypothetical protein
VAADFLFADDNRMCGGHNVSFYGIFIRRAECAKSGIGDQ